MGKTVIVTGGTHKDVSAMGVLALNLKEVAPRLADKMIIFHDGIKKKEQQIIKEIFPTIFYEYSFPIDFRTRRKNRSLRYFTQMLFCKYECFRLLEKYDRVIWTDYDVLILKDLGELLGNKKSFQIVESHNPLKQMFLPNASVLDMSEYDLERKGVCTPLFVVTKQIGNYQEYYEWCIKATLKYAAYIDLPEQCIISLLIQKFGIEYFRLPDYQYAAYPIECNGNESILHSYGRPKFWEGLYNREWDKYYREWLGRGGSKYKKPLKEKIIQFMNK